MKYIVFWIVLITVPCPNLQIDQVTGLPSEEGFNSQVGTIILDGATLSNDVRSFDCQVTDTIIREAIFIDSAEMHKFVHLLNKDERVDSFSVTEVTEKVIYEKERHIKLKIH